MGYYVHDFEKEEYEIRYKRAKMCSTGRPCPCIIKRCRSSANTII